MTRQLVLFIVKNKKTDIMKHLPILFFVLVSIFAHAQTWRESQTSNCFWSQTNTVSVSNTATATSILGTGGPNQSLTVPATFWFSGRQVILNVKGVYSTLTTLPGSITITIKLGTVTLATGTISNLLTNASSVTYNGSFAIRCVTTGSSGSVLIDGQFLYSQGNLLSRASLEMSNNGAPISIDISTGQTVDVQVTWATASASNIWKSTICSLTFPF